MTFLVLFTEKNRYELPSCTLEVRWRRSPLSAWTTKPLATDLRFKLQLGKQLIQGDRVQLAELTDCVSRYTHAFLATEEIVSLTHVLEADHLPRLNLDTLQLFDLLTNLEQFNDQVELLPPGITQAITPKISGIGDRAWISQIGGIIQIIPAWGQVAATVCVGVLASVGIMQWVSPNTQPIANQAKPTASAPIAKLENLPRPRTLPQQSPKRLPSFLDPKASSNSVLPQTIRILPRTPPPAPDPVLDPPKNSVIASVPNNLLTKPAPPNDSETKLLGDLKGEFKMEPKLAPNLPNGEPDGKAVTGFSDERRSRSSFPSATGRADNFKADRVQIDRVQVDKLQSERGEPGATTDLNASLSQHLRATGLRSDRPGNGEVVFEITITEGRVREVIQDSQVSTIEDSGLNDSIRGAITTWKIPANTANGRARLTIKVTNPE